MHQLPVVPHQRTEVTHQRGGVAGVLLWIVVAIFVIGLLVVIGAGKLIF